MPSFRRLFLASLLALAGCSSSSAETTVAPGQDGAIAPETGADAPSSAATYKTYVILGDSISDGGGQGPFFYDLFYADLQARYPGIVKVKNSKAGATANGLVTQTQTLPTALDGPVLVTITIGGNDVQGALGTLATGGSDAKARTAFTDQLDTALTELTKPDRFGAGVQVKVLLANIYDPSDGTGNFTYQGKKCPGALGFWPAGNATDPLLTPWEQIMTDTAAKYPQVQVLPLHDRFHGHGVAAMPTWFYSDCIHPNSAGHAEIRGLFSDGLPK
jgi:lysophospholipase L1-like esterase